MGGIEIKLKETLQTQEEKFHDDPQFKEFEKANEEFKNLIQKGIIKERGYNLLTIESAHLNDFHFNVK